MEPNLDGYVELTLRLDAGDVPAFVWVSLSMGELDDWGDAVVAATGETLAWQAVQRFYHENGSTFEAEHLEEVLRQSLVGFWTEPPSRASLARPGLRKAAARHTQKQSLKSVG